jgi:hypothetical protein
VWRVRENDIHYSKLLEMKKITSTGISNDLSISRLSENSSHPQKAKANEHVNHDSRTHK